MDNLFLIVFLLSTLLLLIGLTKPSLVVRWGAPEKRGRKQALITYLSIALISFIAFGITTDSNKVAPVVTPVLTAEQQLEQIAQDATKENFKKITISPPDSNGKRIIEIQFAGEENPSIGYAKMKTFETCANLFEKIYASGIPIMEVNEVAYMETVDKYGKTSDSPVIKMTLKAETAAKIHWQNIDILSLNEIMDKAWIHPSLLKDN